MAFGKKDMLHGVPTPRKVPTAHKLQSGFRLLAPATLLILTIALPAPSQTMASLDSAKKIEITFSGKKPSEKEARQLKEAVATAWGAIKQKFPEIAKAWEGSRKSDGKAKIEIEVLNPAKFNLVQDRAHGGVKRGDKGELYFHAPSSIGFESIVREISENMGSTVFYDFADPVPFARGTARAIVSGVIAGEINGDEKTDENKAIKASNDYEYAIAFNFVRIMKAENFVNAVSRHNAESLKEAYDARYGIGAYGKLMTSGDRLKQMIADAVAAGESASEVENAIKLEALCAGFIVGVRQ